MGDSLLAQYRIPNVAEANVPGWVSLVIYALAFLGTLFQVRLAVKKEDWKLSRGMGFSAAGWLCLFLGKVFQSAHAYGYPIVYHLDVLLTMLGAVLMVVASILIVIARRAQRRQTIVAAPPIVEDGAVWPPAPSAGHIEG